MLKSTNSFFPLVAEKNITVAHVDFTLSQSNSDLGLGVFSYRVVKNIGSLVILSIQGKSSSFLKRAQSCLP